MPMRTQWPMYWFHQNVKKKGIQLMWTSLKWVHFKAFVINFDCIYKDVVRNFIGSSVHFSQSLVDTKLYLVSTLYF